MAVPRYKDIYNAIQGDTSWVRRLTISVSQLQKAQLVPPNPTPAQIAWANRDPHQEAQRIIFYVLGTAPVVSMLDAPDTILDSHLDTALATVFPNLLKAVVV